MNDYNWEERNIITFDRPEDVALYTNDLHVWYGTNEAIKGIDLQFEKNKITALIGPSGCGKSTYLRSLNRMNDGICEYERTGQLCTRVSMSIRKKSMSMKCANGLAWFFNVQILSVNQFMTISHLLCVVMVKKNKKKLDEIVETKFETSRSVGSSQRQPG